MKFKKLWYTQIVCFPSNFYQISLSTTIFFQTLLEKGGVLKVTENNAIKTTTTIKQNDADF